ncbi:hypothetical protein CDD81_6867 [Ophiocordyceps australis]|uniref:Uncharacterized protein n=1 Tax=Ophiocordyceps australis TaxID=1399860 RepID=A0A2C5Y4R1_9HYPO|nr:hypothetical protein CDD81_6867 [Ophiocordyceps australis]
MRELITAVEPYMNRKCLEPPECVRWGTITFTLITFLVFLTIYLFEYASDHQIQKIWAQHRQKRFTLHKKEMARLIQEAAAIDEETERLEKMELGKISKLHMIELMKMQQKEVMKSLHEQQAVRAQAAGELAAQQEEEEEEEEEETKTTKKAAPKKAAATKAATRKQPTRAGRK